MKFKIFSFKSIVTYLTIVSFYIATTLSAFAAPLPPISLAQMYSLASQGNVRALRAAVQRGMNIDATDRYGNTGLCHSIYQNNYTAYNAFHASGANPRHPCIQNIPPQQYDYFMASSRATPVTATPRDAYKEFADGEFVFSTTTWVIGGLLLAGGIAAIALSGGGGGKKHHYYFPPNDSFTPTDDSLGAFVGTETPSAPENSPYTPVKITNGENDSNFTLSNDSQIKVGDETKNLVDVINLNDSVLDYTKYIQVGMKAIDGNQVVNGKIPLPGTEVGATITLQNNTAGMVALHNSNAINNNTLKIIARNGTLGMIASDKSLVRNNGNIDIAFQGTTATDQVDGMYADTSSTAINDGKITGNAAVDSVAGTLIGMQGRLINQVQNPAGTIPTQLINNGNISLSAAATPDKTISTSLVGMGSFLEKAFLEGTKLLRRTGFIEITNAANGVIDLNVNLDDSGTYDSTQSNLLNGTGGIVGIRSDAHTTATNNGAIRLTIAPESTNNITNSHAGMLSVHGGTIVNNKEITVTGGIGGYGMLGVRGEGTNSEFNTLNPTIVNSESGTISVNSTDGFGMATRHGGTVVNKGTIKMLAKGTGLQINAGTGTNSGTITLSNGGDGMTIRQNVTTEAGTANNASSAKIQNTETGVIDIKYANGSNGMFIEDGTAENNGSIKINGTDSTTTEASYGIHAQNGTMLNTGSIDMDVILSGDADSYGMYGENSASATNAATGKITFTRKGTGMYTTQGTNTNHGQIVMNGIGSTGMASESGAVLNGKTGSIQLVSGTGIKSTSGSVTNQGSINISQGEDSVGISSGSNAVNDKDATIQITGANSTGISVEENATAVNRGTITLTSTQNSKENYGMISAGGERAQIDNDGIINLNGYGYAASKEVGYGMSIGDGRANNNNTININRMYGYGMASTEGTLTNNGTINLTNGGYGIMGESGESFNNKDATITITGTPNMQNSYGISMQDGTAKNFGQIDVTGGSVDSKTYGISVNGGNGLNHGLINMHSDNAFGLFDEGDGEITNVAGGTINLYGNNSVGMQTTSGKAENFGTINIGVDNGTGAIVGGSGSTGMIAGDGATAINSGHINMNGNNAVGMTANGGTVINDKSGTINLGGTGAIGLQADGGTATNSGSLKVSGTDTVGLYANGGTVVNSGTIEFSSGDAAVLVDDGIGRNDKTITVTSSNLEAMRADGGEAVNASGGTITLNSSANNSTAMYATRGKITNNGTIALNGNSGIGMMTEAEGTANNTGTINVSGADSVGILADGGTATNSSGTINVTGSSSFGMKATEGEAINNATINANNNIGMFADGGIVTNGSSGKINAGSGASYLMLAENGGTANNKGTLTFSGSGSALQAKGATVNNTGSITATGSGNGMAADGTSSAGANAVNSGTITVNSGKGMIATSTTIDTTVTNASGGVITVNSNGGVGMYADGSHARAINLGTINIKGTSSTSYGMKAVNGGSVENAGTINMAAGSAGTGIYVDGKSTFYNNASGKIVFAGGQTQSGTITGDTSAGSVDICDDGGSCANKFIHLEQGATLQNSGTMVTSASFKLNEMGGGRVLLASTGTMVAGNEISGDLYAVSDRAMLEQGQKDVYVNRNALTASEIDVNLMSASPMWEVSLVDSAEDSADDAAAQAEDEPAVEQPTVKDEDEADNDSSTSDKPSSEKDIVYNRVAFSNLVNNASQAAYLESNYAIRNTIYDGMITAGSMEEFNQVLYSNLGLDLIPNFAKQNMDILRNVNRQVNSAVFNNNDTKEFRVHVGYDYFEREQDGTNGLSGYEDEAHTGYALFDKKYNANFRYGLGTSFTKYSSDYDNGAERDEVIAQIMAPLIFETDSTKVVSIPRIGMGWGEYTRYDHTGEYKADTRNYYYGITNEARHELDMGLLTLEPVAEFNIIGLYQGRTKENIRVDSGNNLSVEGGLGLYARKSFKPMGDDELNIRLGGTYYHEFNNPYQAVSAGIVGLQGRYHMNSYETQRNRAVLSSRFDYKRGKFNFYLEGSRFIEDDSTYSVNAGLTYAF